MAAPHRALDQRPPQMTYYVILDSSLSPFSSPGGSRIPGWVGPGRPCGKTRTSPKAWASRSSSTSSLLCHGCRDRLSRRSLLRGQVRVVNPNIHAARFDQCAGRGRPWWDGIVPEWSWALVLVGLPELLREFGEFRLHIYGAILVAIMILRPEGLIPDRRRRRSNFTSRATLDHEDVALWATERI